MFPQYWTNFLEQNSLLGASVTIPEHADKSGVGAEMDFLSVESALEESEKFYPGIAVAVDGYIPVANCLIGSGDPYFINENDGQAGPLYRVYHDAVSETEYQSEEAIDVVLEDYGELLNYLD